MRDHILIHIPLEALQQTQLPYALYRESVIKAFIYRPEGSVAEAL